MEDKLLSPSDITEYAHQSDRVKTPCDCAKREFAAWDSMPATFPEELLACVGRVLPHSDEELTVKEFHPHGTNYWSPDAPIALHYFPANRSEVWQCKACARCYLRYTEYGGYYIDKRIRALQADLLVP